MVSLFGTWRNSLRTWPDIRTSNDIWPMSKPCWGRFHHSSLILHTNKCTARSHRSTPGCFLEVPLGESEAQCLGCAEDLLGGCEHCPAPWHLKMSLSFFSVFWEGERGFLALSVGPQQMANWTATVQPSGAILMLHMLHPGAITSWRMEILAIPHSHHHDYTIQNVVNTFHCVKNTNTQQHKSPLVTINHHVKHSKSIVGYYFINPTHSGDAVHWVTIINSC